MTKKSSKKTEVARQKTHVAIVLDKSGSMGGTVEETVSGVNAQITEAQKNAAEQDILMSFITFNDEVFEHCCNVPAADMPRLTVVDYVPDGGTALKDGLGYAIDMLKRTTTPDDNTSYMVIVVTDGQDNTRNQHYSWAQIAESREALEKTGKWTFRFMGCDEHYIKKVAEDIGVHISNCALWSNQSKGLATAGMMRSAGSSSKYYAARSRGLTLNACVDSDLECCMADYTSGVDEVVPAVDIQTPAAPAVDLNCHHTPQQAQGVIQSRSIWGSNNLLGIDPMLSSSVPSGYMQSPAAPVDWNANQAHPTSGGMMSGKPVTWTC